jgi:hypothetical protein
MKAIEMRLLSIGMTLVVMLFSPVPCWAATAALPWDQTLLALEDTLIAYIAPAAIGFALSGAIILYALGGRDEQAGRLFGSALGGAIALVVVKLLDYVLP